MSKPIKHSNAFICYRKDKIDHGSKLKMTDHSRLIASKWQDESDLCKRKYYQAAAKDYVDKEIASGGNGTIIKSFEQFGNIAFVNEIPINKQPLHDFNDINRNNRNGIGQNSDQYLHDLNNNRNNEDIKQNVKESVSNQVTNDEDLFDEFTINTDFYVQQPTDLNDNRDKIVETGDIIIPKKRARNYCEEKPEKSLKLKLKDYKTKDREIFESFIFNGVPLFDKSDLNN